MPLPLTVASFLPRFLNPTTVQDHDNDQMSNHVRTHSARSARSDSEHDYSQRMQRRERGARRSCEDARREEAETGSLARTTRFEDGAGTARNLPDISHGVNSEHRYQVEACEREDPRHRDQKGVGFPSRLSPGEQSKETVQQNRWFKEGNPYTTGRTFTSTAEKVPTVDKLNELKEKNKRLKEQLEDYELKMESVNGKLKESESENKHLRAQLEAKEGQHAADRQLLEQRTREVQCARTYLTPVRSYSGRELINLVEEVNTEVLHAAASITDAVDLTLRSDKDHCMEGKDFLAEVKVIVGDEVAKILLKSNSSSDAFRSVVQNTLQTAILRHLQHMLNSWSANPNDSRLFEETYESIRKNVKRQSIAGRWKALTKAQSKYASYADMEQFIGKHIFDSILSILHVFTGKLNKKDFDRRLCDIVESHIREILTRADQLDKVLGEIIDEDWGVFYILPGARFDQSCMVDTYATPTGMTRLRGQSGSELQITPTATIFCATDLGLWKRGSGTGERQVMLKAKVLLQTTVMEGLNESNGDTQFR